MTTDMFIFCLLFPSLETPVLPTQRLYVIILLWFSGLLHFGALCFEDALSKQDLKLDSQKSYGVGKLPVMLSDSSPNAPIWIHLGFFCSFMSLTHPRVVLPFSSLANSQLFPASYLGVVSLLSLTCCSLQCFISWMRIFSWLARSHCCFYCP